MKKEFTVSNTRWTELTPNDGHISFYNKAYVARDENGVKTLFSYGTPIIQRAADGSLTRLWDGWSATTGRHIRAFCGMGKARFLALPLPCRWVKTPYFTKEVADKTRFRVAQKGW